MRKEMRKACPVFTENEAQINSDSSNMKTIILDAHVL